MIKTSLNKEQEKIKKGLEARHLIDYSGDICKSIILFCKIIVSLFIIFSFLTFILMMDNTMDNRSILCNDNIDVFSIDFFNTHKVFWDNPFDNKIKCKTIHYNKENNKIIEKTFYIEVEKE